MFFLRQRYKEQSPSVICKSRWDAVSTRKGYTSVLTVCFHYAKMSIPGASLILPWGKKPKGDFQ